MLLTLRSKLPPAALVRELIGAAILALLLRTGWKVAEWNTERFVVTDARILLVGGLVSRRVAMLPLRKVTDMSYRRSPLGRMLGYGEFVMESAGERQSLQRVSYLPNPDTLYLQLSELLFARTSPLSQVDRPTIPIERL